VEECGKLDFLPFTCQACGETTCFEHRTYEGHGCKGRGEMELGGRLVECPVCTRPVAWSPSQDPNVVLAAHIDAGCPRRKRENPKCALEECTVREAVPVRCKSCSKQYCIRHRSELDHRCTRRPAQGHSRADGNRPELPRRQKANDVAFANSELDPVGNGKLEAGDRFPLVVFFPSGSKQKPTHMFFHRRHTIGKVLDEIQLKFPDKIPAPPTESGQGRLQLYPLGANFDGHQPAPHMNRLCEMPGLCLLDPVLIDYQVSDQRLSTCRAVMRRTLPASHPGSTKYSARSSLIPW